VAYGDEVVATFPNCTYAVLWQAQKLHLYNTWFELSNSLSVKCSAMTKQRIRTCSPAMLMASPPRLMHVL
jgi:hypothetical protein